MVQAVVFDTAGPVLDDSERAFFRDADPWGFILFARHCQSPDQVRRLCADLCDSVGRMAPVLIDQEGGRVSRMKPGQHAEWHEHPPMGVLGALWQRDRGAAKRASSLNGFLLGRMIKDSGVTLNCAPMLDVRQGDSDPITMGDRTFSDDPECVTVLSRTMRDGLALGGVQPVMKHLPGLGRAACDSHYALPVIDTDKESLAAHDWPVFKALHDTPFGMTAHALIPDLDPDHCVTHSETIIREVIRGEIGFSGILFSDDLKMEALGGAYPNRLACALKAGCDIGLACNFSLEEKVSIAGASTALSSQTKDRADRALEWKPENCPDIEGDYAELAALLAPVWRP